VWNVRAKIFFSLWFHGYNHWSIGGIQYGGIIIIIIIIIIYLFTAIGIAPGGSSPTLVQKKNDKATLYSSTTQYNKT
jgi:hypothetical protein